MATKSGLISPDPRWLIAEPDNALARSTMDIREFMTRLGQWRMRSGLVLDATAGAFLSFDFAGLPEALPPGDADMSDRYFDDLIAAMRKRVQVVNAFALCLHSASIDVDNLSTDGFRVTHEDLVHFDDIDAGFGGPGIMRMPVVPGLGYVLPHHRHGVCSPELIASASDMLDEVMLNRHDKALDLVVLLNHALTACKGHDFELSVVTAWTVCEALLDMRWGEFTEQRAAAVSLPVNRSRRDFWSGRDFTASVIGEVLALGGAIPTRLHDMMGNVRRKRNRWVHGVETAGHSDAVEAINLARDLLSEVYGLALSVSPAVGVSGL